MEQSYDKACENAATGQGLDPMTERLTREGIAHRVDQTGGFCMVIAVPVGNERYRIPDTAEIGITADGPEASPWLVLLRKYPDGPDVPEDMGTILGSDVDTDRAITIIRHFQANGVHRQVVTGKNFTTCIQCGVTLETVDAYLNQPEPTDEYDYDTGVECQSGGPNCDGCGHCQATEDSNPPHAL